MGNKINLMEFKQDTIQDIIESESQIMLHGAELYGEFFINASGFNNLLNNFIKSIDDPEKFIFIAFISQVKKHHTLALFSATRRHHIQAGLDLRYVLEAGAWAAYAMAHKDKNKFCETDTDGILSIPERLEKAKNKWIDGNFKVKSDEIKRLKELINRSVAHSNIVYTFQNFETKLTKGKGFYTPFFDFDDDYKIKTDLWSVANIARGLIDLFYGVNLQYKVFRLINDFGLRFKELSTQNDRLKAEMTKHPRYQRAMARRHNRGLI